MSAQPSVSQTAKSIVAHVYASFHTKMNMSRGWTGRLNRSPTGAPRKSVTSWCTNDTKGRCANALSVTKAEPKPHAAVAAVSDSRGLPD